MKSEEIQRLQAGMEAERQRGGPPAEFTGLPPIPGDRYRDSKFLALENDHLWRSAWLYAGHLDELPRAGSYKLWQRLGIPVVIVRDRAGTVRAFYNSCRHRGGPLVTQDAGQLSAGLTCHYHGWTYDLDGSLKGVRDQRDFVGLDVSCHHLIPLSCELLGNWIFVNQDPDAMDLRSHLGPVYEYFSDLPLDSLRLVQQQTFPVQCHYKVLLEGFLEVYHLNAVHAGTVDRFLEYRSTHIELWNNGHSLMLTPNSREGWSDPGARGMVEMTGISDLERKANPSFNIFPNLVTPVAPTGLPFNVIWPVSDDSSLLEVVWFAPDWGDGPRHENWETRLANYERIIGEDMQLVETIQKGVHSPAFRNMSLNYQERRIYFWHEELDRRIGSQRVPEHLRVRPTFTPQLAEATS